MNQDNQEALGLKKEYTALLRNVDQLTSLVERASAMGAQLESRQAAWDNYQLANLPSKYFRELVGTFESRMLEYRQTIETIEKFVDTSSSLKIYTPSSTLKKAILNRNIFQLFFAILTSSILFYLYQVLKEIMQAQMEYFLTLTAQVSQMHDGLSDLQERVSQTLKDRPGVTVPAFIDPYAPKQKKEKTVPKPTFEYVAVEPQPGTGVAPAATTTGFGAKPTGFGSTATGTTGFGAKPTGFGSTATGTTGFGAKPAGTGFGSSFGAKPAGTTGFGATAGAAGTTGFGGAAKTGFGASTPAAKTTGFGSTGGTTGFGAKPAGTGFGAGAASTGFRTPAF